MDALCLVLVGVTLSDNSSSSCSALHAVLTLPAAVLPLVTQ